MLSILAQRGSKGTFNRARVHVRKGLTGFSSSSSAPQRGGAQPPKGPVTWLGLVLVALVGAGLGVAYELEKDRRMLAMTKVDNEASGKADIGGPWVLVNQDGEAVTDAMCRGQYSLLYFGFTHCPDICPSELVKVGNIMKELERRKATPIKPFFISVDPHRDTVQQLKHYSQDFSPAWTFLTGTPDMVAKATRAFRVYFTKADEVEDDDEEYLVDHSIVLYLMSPEGDFLEFFTQRMEVVDIVDKIVKRTEVVKQ